MSSLTFNKLILQNFGPYIGKHVFILDRGPGLFYLTGMNKVNPELQSNDVGKSTIWDSLLWCLFGRTGRDNKPGTAIVSWGLEKKTTKASLLFHRDKASYIIRRTKHPNLLRLKTLGVWKTIVQDEVIELLGMSEAMFRLSIVLTQFGTMFLDLRPEAQSQMFNEALNLGVYLKASERAGKDAKGYHNVIAEKKEYKAHQEGKLSALRKQIKFEMVAEEQFLSNKKQSLAEIISELKVHKKRLQT